VSDATEFQAQLESIAVDIERARRTLSEAAEHVREQPADPLATGVRRAVEDPHVIFRFGQLRARVHAAEGLLARARRRATAAVSGLDDQGPPAIVALAEARSFAREVAAEIGNQLAAWGAGAGAGPGTGDWSHYHIGNYYLSGVLPPEAQS
jgi:alkylation response protein AidB-like acyl-CoA dehydrogenase